jgi:hypothetical protein
MVIVCNRNDEGIAVSLNSNNNTFGPGNIANFNGHYGIILFPGISGNVVKKNDFHCNVIRDIFDLGTDTQFIKNSTGPLPECQYPSQRPAAGHGSTAGQPELYAMKIL